MLQSSGGAEVEMREEGCSPTELHGKGGDSSQGDQPMVEEGAVAISPRKVPGTKSSSVANGFPRDPKVQCATTHVHVHCISTECGGEFSWKLCYVVLLCVFTR